MANYYSDIPELKYHLENPMMKRIVELKERDFRDKDEFDYAPRTMPTRWIRIIRCWIIGDITPM